MERRNWTLESFNELIYIDSQEDDTKAELLVTWVQKYTSDTSSDVIKIETSDFIPVLNKNKLYILLELFYKNVNFLKLHKLEVKSQLDSIQKIRTFIT
jgi:hypothetical protein